MSIAAAPGAMQASAAPEATPQLWTDLRYWLGNWKLTVGLILIVGLTVFSLIGSTRVSFSQTHVGSGPFNVKPSAEHPFGTDNVRRYWALMVHGIYPSLKVGLIAGLIGTALGVVLGIITGYYGGMVDTIISTMADIFLTIPSLLIDRFSRLYSHHDYRIHGVGDCDLRLGRPHALDAFANPESAASARLFPWPNFPGKMILRLQSNRSCPNLLPYIMAGFVGAVSGAILSLVGIQIFRFRAALYARSLA